MNEDTSHLAKRRYEVYAAIEILERDLANGTIDADSYARTRMRYESEAARLLEQEENVGAGAPAPHPRGAFPRRPVVLGAVTAALLALAVGLFLVNAVRARTAGAAITGDIGGATPVPPAPSAELLAAQNAVRLHARDVDARLSLAQAYADQGQVQEADAAYRDAIKIAPNRPEPRTMFAMYMGSGGNTKGALSLLDAVEQAQPGFARAWLVDGLLSSRSPGGLSRAIRSWRRFLALAPHSSVAGEVRALIHSAVAAEKKRR